ISGPFIYHDQNQIKQYETMRIISIFRWGAAVFFLYAGSSQAQLSLKPIQSVGFENVKIDDGFWKPRMDKVATVTLQACINYTEIKTPRIRNFERAAAHNGKHEGIYYDDSDVYKALEAIAYSLRSHPDAAMEKKA